MKVMNEIQAEISGEITKILVENGTAVQYGEPLFRVKTA
jgi:acetyl-CoA carboxylase biotin carboxyl carrier protein